jgi:class 3 adenylate cyclase/tetratricopeptide (TPR) repeat protein
MMPSPKAGSNRPGRTYDQRVTTNPQAGERKVVTVLFVDVTGSTELADTLDAEDLREVMSEWFAAARAEIEAQGGTVEKYIGDAVMAVFGVPSAHEDDPARALRAALAMRERLVELNERLQGHYGITMEIRTGINTGEAVTTLNPAPGEAIVTGVAVNAAARLEQLAEPGQTVVAERTVRAAPGFRFDDLGDKHLRGKEEPIRAFLLLEEERDAPVRGLPGMHAPLVGRHRELELLLAVQERVVAERRPHLATIYGDPGVGKSRLVRELLARLAAAPTPPRIVVGRCLSYGDGITYWPLAGILKSLAGISDDDAADTAIARIEELMDDAPTAALAFTLGLDAHDDAFARLQPSAIRAELARAWRTLLSTLADRQPLVVVVDDIHWADAVLLDLLEELAERAQGPILFVCPARLELTGTRPSWGGGRRSFSSVFLSPLAEADAAELVSKLLDVDGLRDDTRSQILARAEGNPFFLEEILRQLIDQGRIVRDAGRWKAVDELRQLELPDTVQGVLAARIDLLQPSEKHTLQHASVVGRIFWRGAVAALVDDDAGLDPDLLRLEERELVTPRINSSMAGEEELAFSHILTRDVAYDSLPRRERPKAHARVARWIEETTGDRQREYAGLLAHHYTEAYTGAQRDRSYPPEELDALRRRTFGLLLEASHGATRGTAYRAARTLAQSAVDIAATPEERATALEVLGAACRFAALGDDAWPAYAGAVDALRGSAPTPDERIARLAGLALETVVRWAGTMAHLPDEATAKAYLDLGLEHLPSGDGEARVRLMTVQAFWAHAFPETPTPFGDAAVAEQTGTAAAEMAMRIGRPDLAVVALDSVQHNLQRQTRFAAAHVSARRRLDLAHEAGNLGELGDSYAVFAWNAVFTGRFREGYDAGLEGYERLIGDAPLFAVHSLSWATLAAFYLGQWDEAQRCLDLVKAGLGERGERLTSGFASPWPAVAFVHEARGESERADELLDQAYSVEGGRLRVSAYLSPLIVRTLLLRGEIAAARERMEQVRGDKELAPLMTLAEAELLLCEERSHDLDSLAATARELGEWSGARYLGPAADRLSGRAAAARAEADEAARLLGLAAAGFDEIEMSIEAAVARLDAAEALQAAGRRDDARERVAQARPVLERVGYARELARADSLS